jgi:hypothetical protein
MSYDSLISLFNRNRCKEWTEWLEFESSFEKPGKQGLVGLLKSKDENDASSPANLSLSRERSRGGTQTPKHIVFKISQYINYLVQHEYTVMRSLLDLSPYCPHFCKPVGIISCSVDPKIRKDGSNPFEVRGSHQISKDVLLLEYVSDSCKFYNYIRSDQVSEVVLYSAIKQVMMAIVVAQKEKRFSHYDLHSYNVMMKTCGKDSVFLYVLDDNNQFAVPTYGTYPMIIDFGFSYVDEMDDGYLWPSMGHTNVGFMSDRFDWVADPKLFLVTVSAELKEKRRTVSSRKFRNVVRNIFGKLTIDWESGWDDVNESGASDEVSELLKKIPANVGGSDLFERYDHYCVDLIQSLIILPLEEQDSSEIKLTFTAFMQEFVKIEKEIGNTFYSLCVLKSIVDLTRKYREDYMDITTRPQAVQAFKCDLYDEIDKLALFCKPKDVQFEKMMCSLLYTARCAEGVLFKTMQKRMRVKGREYSKMPVQSVEEIFGILQCNLPDSYVYTENTMVYVFDCMKKENRAVRVRKEDLEELNDTAPISQGSVLWELYGGV